jgi:hypothetical protein
LFAVVAMASNASRSLGIIAATTGGKRLLIVPHDLWHQKRKPC